MSDTTDNLAGQIVENLEPGCLITKWVFIAEVIDTEGQRAFWSDHHEDATRWDLYGLLTEQLEALRVDHAGDIHDAEDEDEASDE